MSAIIKADDRNASVQGVAYNLTDMANEANRRLDKFRVDATGVLAKARQEAETIRKQAEIDGGKAAEETVRRQLGQEFDRQISTLMPALEQVIQDIQYAKQAWLAQWEKSAVHVAAAIAGRLIRRELEKEPEIALTLIREALELAAGSSKLRIHLNPEDHKTLGPQVESLINELARLADTELVADPAITPGGCRVETRFGMIDQQFEAQLARIEEELT